MSYKETAIELIDKHRTIIRAADKYEYLDPEDEFHLAGQCALISVNLRLGGTFMFSCIEYGEDSLEYWQQVKKEIENYEL